MANSDEAKVKGAVAEPRVTDWTVVPAGMAPEPSEIGWPAASPAIQETLVIWFDPMVTVPVGGVAPQPENEPVKASLVAVAVAFCDRASVPLTAVAGKERVAGPTVIAAMAVPAGMPVVVEML